MAKLQKAISPKALQAMKFKTIPLKGQLKALIGTPELKGSWIIWGTSGNGKSRLALQITKELAKFARVAYNSLEEGQALSMQKAFTEVGMDEVSGKVVLLNAESIEDLKIRLQKRRSPRIVVIDSVQYTGMNYKAYKELREDLPNHLFILISHAEGKEPAGRVAKQIRYDSFVKIHVEGYKATALSRYGGGEDYIIWNEGHDKYWGKTASNETY